MGINLERNNKSWNLSEVVKVSGESTPAEFADSLEKMDAKLNEIKKEITYWDVYNIVSAITSPEEFDSKVANLEINSSTVINTTHFKHKFNGIETDFYSGDVIIRLKDGSDYHIKAANAGLYVPTLTRIGDQTDESGNTTFGSQLQITYNYETAPPIDANNNYKSFSTQIQTLSGDESKTYGFVLEPTISENTGGSSFPSSQAPFSFKIIKNDNSNIVPVIKLFIAKPGNSSQYQEIFSDQYTLYYDNDNFYFYLHSALLKIVSKVVIK